MGPAAGSATTTAEMFECTVLVQTSLTRGLIHNKNNNFRRITLMQSVACVFFFSCQLSVKTVDPLPPSHYEKRPCTSQGHKIVN